MTSMNIIMHIEMWLKADDKVFKFPVLPSSFDLDNSSIIETSNIVNLGQVAMYGGNALKTISISSFFPSKEYQFCTYYGFPQPYECVKMIEEWRAAGKQIRLIITSTPINMPVLIESFEWGERAGTRDVEFTLTLKEYKPITIKTTPPTTTTPEPTPRPVDTPTTNKQKTHKVKKGESLWAITQKYTGKGSRYPELKKANQEKYPKLKKSNIIYVNWELILPW